MWNVAEVGVVFFIGSDIFKVCCYAETGKLGWIAEITLDINLISLQWIRLKWTCLLLFFLEVVQIKSLYLWLMLFVCLFCCPAYECIFKCATQERVSGVNHYLSSCPVIVSYLSSFCHFIHSSAFTTDLHPSPNHLGNISLLADVFLPLLPWFIAERRKLPIATN